MRVIRNSFIYTAVKILKNGIGLFLLPVYTVYLTTADYGVVSVVTSLVNFVSIFLLLSMNGAGVRFHYDHANDENELKSLWGTIYSAVLVNGLLITGVLILGHRYLVEPFFKDVPFYPYLLFGLLTCLFQAGFSVFQAYLRASQQGEKFGANDMGFFLLKIGLTLIFVVVFKLAAYGVILALAASNLVFMLTSHFRFRRVVTLGINRTILRQALGYGLPMLPHALAGWAMTLIDRVFLVNMKSASDVGIYTIGFQVASVLQMLAIAANQAYSPWFYQKCKEGEEGKKKIRELSEFFVNGFTVAGLLLVLLSKEVLEIFVTKEFEAGWVVAPFLVFAFVFRGLYFMVVGPIFLRRVRFLPMITISTAFLNIALNYLLIPLYGIIGAAVASMGTMFVASVATLVVSIRLEDIGYRWFRMFGVTLIGAALSMIVFLHDQMPLWQMLLVKGTVALSAVGLFVLRYRERGMQLLTSLRK